MNDPVQIDPRQRLRELLAIPERDRTDEQWDELVELEIQTAPGNRLSQPQGDPGRRPGPQAEPGRRPGPPRQGQGPRPGPRQGQGQQQQRQAPRGDQVQAQGAKPEDGADPQAAKRNKRHRRPPPKV
jgi:hypothetical protein